MRACTRVCSYVSRDGVHSNALCSPLLTRPIALSSEGGLAPAPRRRHVGATPAPRRRKTTSSVFSPASLDLPRAPVSPRHPGIATLFCHPALHPIRFDTHYGLPPVGFAALTDCQILTVRIEEPFFGGGLEAPQRTKQGRGGGLVIMVAMTRPVLPLGEPRQVN